MSKTLLSYQVGTPDEGTYLRDILSARFNLSHSLLVRLKHQHRIKVNGETALTSYQVNAGDIITIDLDFDEESGIVPQEIPLDIIYQDQDFLVINKPPGMSIHPSRRGGTGTLANAVTHYWLKKGRPTLFRPINRLDRDTSGLVLIGSSQFAHQGVFRQFDRRLIDRQYTALVEGVVEDDFGSIDLPIARLDETSRRRIVHPEGQPAVTKYRVLKRYPSHTLLALRLETGRTHQIRVHLSHLGHPLCGDRFYGGSDTLIDRQALHAGMLSFTHPRCGEEVTLTAPLPGDIQDAIALAGHRKGG